MIYLDNNATTRVADEVVSAMTPYYREWFGNPHAIHSLGRRSYEAVETARSEIAGLLGCEPPEIVFTSCGTEGNALAIRGLVDRDPGRKRVVTTAVEHPSVLSLLNAFARTGAIQLAVVPVGNDGEIDLDAMRAAVDGRTLLVSVMLAQNETGVIHPVAEIAGIAHRSGALLHVDAVQAAGKIPISVTDLGADLLTISGHKFHAPKGVAAIAVRRGTKLEPIWLGGGQELGLRSGTEAVPSIVGMGVAARMAGEALPLFDHVRALRDRFESAILSSVGETSVNGGSQPRIGNTSSIAFHDVPADALVLALDAEELCASAGAACTSGKAEPTSTMRAMGKPLRVAMGSVRFSLSRYTTEEEIDLAIAIVQRAVAKFRQGGRAGRL